MSFALLCTGDWMCPYLQRFLQPQYFCDSNTLSFASLRVNKILHAELCRKGHGIPAYNSPLAWSDLHTSQECSNCASWTCQLWLIRASWFTQQAVPWLCDGGVLLLHHLRWWLHRLQPVLWELQTHPKLLSKPSTSKRDTINIAVTKAEFN